VKCGLQTLESTDGASRCVYYWTIETGWYIRSAGAGSDAQRNARKTQQQHQGIIYPEQHDPSERCLLHSGQNALPAAVLVTLYIYIYIYIYITSLESLDELE